MKANSPRAALLSSTSGQRDAYFSFSIALQLIQPQFDRDIGICNRGSPGIRFLTSWVSRNANTPHCCKCSARFHLVGSFDLFQGIGLHGDGMAIDEQNDRHHRSCLIRLLPSLSMPLRRSISISTSLRCISTFSKLNRHIRLYSLHVLHSYLTRRSQNLSRSSLRTRPSQTVPFLLPSGRRDFRSRLARRRLETTQKARACMPAPMRLAICVAIR
jgi:hypothetical protein